MQRVTLLRSLFRLLLRGIPDKFFYIFSLEIQAKSASYTKSRLKQHGKNLQLASSAFIVVPEEVIFGDDCAVNEFVHILGGKGVRCGDGVWIANHVSLTTATHSTDTERIEDGDESRDLSIRVDDHVWIGSHAVILPGVTLGRSCIVGAGAIVTKDVPPYAIVAGVPAKILRYKNVKHEQSADAQPHIP